MATSTIVLPEEQAIRLHELARDAGVTPHVLLSADVGEWLARPGADFAEAAAYVLKMNRELYRRLE